MSRTKTITTTAATFGAALTSLYAAPELHADITDLTFDPSTVAAGNGDNGIPVNINSYCKWHRRFTRVVCSD